MRNIAINPDRLWASLMETAAIGGTAKGGIRRLTLGEEDRRVRDWFAGECRKLGCTITIDEIGNMFALYPGADADAGPIAMGSHLDTQPTGGKFDGVLGVLAGLEVLRSLHESGYRTRRPLMLVNWTNEEGSRFPPAMLGSGVHAGVFSADFARSQKDTEGTTFGDALESIGYRGEASAGSVKFAAMLELHIEQGPILEAEGMTIGIVHGVQGMRWFDLKVVGTEAHSGSTPMAARKDALVAAAKLVLAIEKIGKSYDGGVATVGFVDVMPNSRNVIPGIVSMSVDLRHPEDAVLDRMQADLVEAAAEIGVGGTSAEVSELWRSPPVRFHEDCIAAVTEGARRSGYSGRAMFSGAGHDAVYAARVAPTAMIFVPCAGGLSHNEAESATPKDCAAGAQVLMGAVLAYDAMQQIQA